MPSSRVLVQTDTWFFVFGSSGLRVWCLLPVPDVPYNDHSQLLLGVLFWTKIRGKYSKGKL
jgi:hypothetical protein